MLLRRADISLRTRLQRLEQNVVDAGCPACCDRRGQTLVRVAEPLADGTVAPVDDLPPPCARCGQISERVINVVETVVAPPIPSP
jgi:hypothetical protein